MFSAPPNQGQTIIWYIILDVLYLNITEEWADAHTNKYDIQSHLLSKFDHHT